MSKDPLDWWKKSVAGFFPQINISEPHAGWFKRKLVRGGPWVPVHFFWEGPRDADGNLIGDEELVAIVNGKERDALEEWPHVADHPISIAEYDFLVSLSDYAKAYDSREPMANPSKPIDRLTAPIPEFRKRKKSK